MVFGMVDRMIQCSSWLLRCTRWLQKGCWGVAMSCRVVARQLLGCSMWLLVGCCGVWGGC